MMINYQGLSKLKTKQVVFQEVFSAFDPGTLEQLKELSSKRRAIEESINESSSVTDAIAREMSGGLTSRREQDLQKLERYLPLLENLVYHVNLVQDNSKIDDLRFELGMALFLNGVMLREQALGIIQTDLVQSATIFRTAAGVHQHLAHEVLPLLQPKPAPEMPPESTSGLSSVMSLICLAEAQAVTARKAEEKGNTKSLLAKLHYGVKAFLDEAQGILHSVTKECKGISARLMDFISSCQMLHELQSYKYLAESLKIDGKIGAAIGVLRFALTNVEKSNPKEEQWRSVFKQVKQDLTGLLQKYEHENDFVWHEKIPSRYDLPSPESLKIVSCIPYHPQRSDGTLVFNI